MATEMKISKKLLDKINNVAERAQKITPRSFFDLFETRIQEENAHLNTSANKKSGKKSLN